jgi:hypothetical protein
MLLRAKPKRFDFRHRYITRLVRVLGITEEQVAVCARFRGRVRESESARARGGGGGGEREPRGVSFLFLLVPPTSDVLAFSPVQLQPLPPFAALLLCVWHLTLLLPTRCQLSRQQFHIPACQHPLVSLLPLPCSSPSGLLIFLPLLPLFFCLGRSSSSFFLTRQGVVLTDLQSLRAGGPSRDYARQGVHPRNPYM